MLDFVKALTLRSMASYAVWKLRGRVGEVDLTFRQGGRARLGRSDFGSAYEVFANGDYNLAPRDNVAAVRRIVDLGANVGMTVLFWLRTYPNARVIAFEPHPAHIARLRANLALNDATARVELHEAAVGREVGEMALIDAGMSSSVVAPDAALHSSVFRTIAVEVEDVFDTLLADPIDILKIDIEGGEFPILIDTRFAAVQARAIVLEWHRTGDGKGEQWCVEKLRAAGYEVRPVVNLRDHGLLWAYKPVD